jgi:aspartate-semialdehyde dehydrogenase
MAKTVKRALSVAVAGANTAAGREVLRALAERGPALSDIRALGPARLAGQELSFGERTLRLSGLEGADLAGFDLVIHAGSAAEARALAPRAAAAGAWLLDLSPAFRLEPGVALLAPGVNPRALTRAKKRRIAALPQPSALFAALVLAPLMALAPLERVVAVSLQPASGAGKEGMDELFAQTRASFVNEIPAPQHFPKPIAFNLIPQTGGFDAEGETAEEALFPRELRKMLDPDLRAGCTALRAPVFVGEALVLHLAFAAPVTVAAARAALGQAPGVALFDRREDGGYATPLEVAGEEVVTVSRLRRDPGAAHGLALWAAGDNLRLGAGVAAAEAVARLLGEGVFDG